MGDRQPFHVSVGEPLTKAVSDHLLSRKEDRSTKVNIPQKATMTMQPGDHMRVGAGSSVSMRPPSAYSLWYLIAPEWVTNILTENTDEADTYLEALDDFFERIAVDPVKVPRNTVEIQNGLRRIWEMRYESRRPGYSFSWSINMEFPNDTVGFLDFVVGPLTVMEIITLAGEITGEVDGTIKSGGDLLPPVPNDVLRSPGVHLVEYGYLTMTNVQQQAPDLTDEAGVIEAGPALHDWLRVFLTDDQTWPTPGEFLALLPRPFIDFPWFYQATSPFLFCGNWFETLYYTSGIVLADNGDNTYSVRIKTETVTASSSDFKAYTVGQRVTILKTSGSSEETFNWKELTTFNSWVIIPITFYAEV